MACLYLVKYRHEGRGDSDIDSTHVTLLSAQTRIRSAINQRVRNAESVTDWERREFPDREKRIWNQYGETHWECENGSTWDIEAHAIRDDGMVSDHIARSFGVTPERMSYARAIRPPTGPVAGHSRDHWGRVAWEAINAMRKQLRPGEAMPHWDDIGEADKEEYRRAGEVVAEQVAAAALPISGRVPKSRKQ